MLRLARDVFLSPLEVEPGAYARRGVVIGIRQRGGDLGMFPAGPALIFRCDLVYHGCPSFRKARKLGQPFSYDRNRIKIKVGPDTIPPPSCAEPAS